MTIEETIAVLNAHKEWRKGSDGPATDPKRLTQALDVAIAVLAEDSHYCKCERPWPNPKGPVFECMNCDKQMK